MTSQERTKTIQKNNFAAVNRELAEFKSTIISEVENYRLRMGEEIDRAVARLTEMEKNSIDKVNSEWQEYEKKIEDHKKNQIRECNEKLDEIGHDTYLKEMIESLAQNAVEDIYGMDRVESSFD